ncbi:MAG: hypothetical protein BGO01_13415 [Armatimonadetes bacterium 55-13]|nr:Gfo/Idh/MocA family oxidoreductase [Armatimonadota bacterium]OJU61907.1 MAG: hypothetical protein BGO01_13415 [Armatimonadetes bacterium 55-13]
MLKVAIVGCGFMGRMHANVYGLLENAQLVALVDRKAEKRETYSKDFGVPAYETIHEMLENHDVDAVDICLPTYEHKDAAIAVAHAGKHVFCEKPMALTVDDAEAMIAACEKAGVRLMIGHCIRFWPEYALLKKMKDEGKYGKLLSINLTRYGEFPFWSTDNWLADESKSGGGVLDMHIHDTDYAHYLLGDPKSVHAWGTVDHRGPSQAFATLTYPDGAVAHLEGGWNLPNHTPFKMAFRAIFERGAAIMDAGPMTIYEDGKDPVVPEFPKMEAAGGGNISDLGGYFHELKYFVDCITQNRPFEISTPETSRKSLETTLEEIRQIKRQ